MQKTKDEPKYKNIPVKPDVYAKVQLLAESNGFGERGLGAQIAHWVGQELPECDHKKVPVEIEYFPGEDLLTGVLSKRHAFYCSTCKRVYAKVVVS